MRLFGHTESVKAVCVSRDSKRIVTGSSDHRVMVWLPNGTLRAVLSGHTDGIRCIAITLDNNNNNDDHLLSLDGDAVCVWKHWRSTDRKLRKQVVVWRPSKTKKPILGAVAASADGQHFFVGANDRIVSMVSLDSLTTVRQLKLRAAVSSLCPTADGQALLVGCYNSQASIQLLKAPNSPNAGLRKDWQ